MSRRAGAAYAGAIATLIDAMPAPHDTPRKIVQISFRYSGRYADFEPVLPGFVQALRSVPGLAWKIWTYDDAAGWGSGLYLFSNEADARAYLATMLPQMRELASDLDARVLDIHVASTLGTHGPIALAA